MDGQKDRQKEKDTDTDKESERKTTVILQDPSLDRSPII